MKIFLFAFKIAIKTAGSAQKKIRVGRVSGNTGIFSALYTDINKKLRTYNYNIGTNM